ncbi:hypothetical protein ACTV1V_003331 [Cronobacter turicensis]|uniref:hypothetical protein n=1 Tax=Cronobacter turicensis TaxID=413502 RepID=UPI00192A333D|nr:hypothetical protein [Cronobacter turicensis]MEB8539141.1 hypothetical protein [Cronobacter sakazakii]EKM0528273.1 hypothetical protein [Cronobacter turicensis]ELQ6000371.1 hypothetical protein [Cronobacter turicensis]ELQ6129668.1 hypothetical protein [Cronobacter turicensis]ELY3553041.1 hypothetical protein [Cronobacter turicensis]
MIINKAEFNILTLLASRDDVKWTWYNLDRAMSQRKMEGVGNVARLVRNLYEAGLVNITPSTPAGMDHYHISAQGMKYLQALHQQKTAQK